ncbi:hypothetical protein [Methanobacterium sp. ACI-7]
MIAKDIIIKKIRDSVLVSLEIHQGEHIFAAARDIIIIKQAEGKLK